MEDLETLYPRASAACKEDPARLEAARRATVDLQAGRPGYRALWKHFITVSEAGLAREFGALGVTFDLWKGESSVDALIAPMIEDLKARGLAHLSEGALVIDVAREDDKKPLPPLLLVKSEGGVLYGTTDLATIIERRREQDPDLVLYVVDHRQHGHFEQVFRAAEKAQLVGQGASGACRLRHHERAGRQAVQDPRRRCHEAARPDRHGEGRGGTSGWTRPASARTGRPKSAPRLRARSASPPSSSPTCRTTAPPTTFSTWSGFQV